jgi:hypothetical protein
LQLNFVRRALSGDCPSDLIERRFEAYYPRLFAYVLSNVGNPGRARDIVIGVFVRVMKAGARAPDEEFRIILFSNAREACIRQARAIPLDFGLTDSEREAITLVFDARLSLDEAEAVSGKMLSALLQRGLEKTQGVGRAEIPSFYRAR